MLPQNGDVLITNKYGVRHVKQPDTFMTAMSRVTNVANLSVLTNADGKTANEVYPEILECIRD